MIEIDDPPNLAGCASCGPLIWLYSPRRGAWVAFIAAPAAGPHGLAPHPCKHAQEPSVWRELRSGDPPSAEYLAAKQALKPSSKE